MDFEYVKEYYGVPACVGRWVTVNGQKGVIAEDRGNYIGVLFDSAKPGQIVNAHPTSNVIYEGVGNVRKPTRSQERDKRYLEYGDGFDSFIDFCVWDASPEREWNKRG